MRDIANIEAPCPVERFVAVVDGPWATLIIRELLVGPRRFGDIKAALPGISPKTLSSRLRRFVELGLATRVAYPEIPPRVVYELTDNGRDLEAVLDAMAMWATTHLPGSGSIAPQGDATVVNQTP